MDQIEHRMDAKVREQKVIGYFMENLEPWVLKLARNEADRLVVIMKKDIIKESIDDAVKASIEHMEERL